MKYLALLLIALAALVPSSMGREVRSKIRSNVRAANGIIEEGTAEDSLFDSESSQRMLGKGCKNDSKSILLYSLQLSPSY